jgi:hypothetical protein
MKLRQVNKLYSKLTPQEQAALVFEAIARGDYEEADAITAAVPTQTLQIYHYDFRRRSCGLNNLALFYGMAYWRAQTHIMFHTRVYNTKAAEQSAIHLASMEAALIEICKRLNVDIEAIKKRALCTGDATELIGFTKPELVEEYTEAFMKLVA